MKAYTKIPVFVTANNNYNSEDLHVYEYNHIICHLEEKLKK